VPARAARPDRLAAARSAKMAQGATTRDAILASCLRLFARHGFSSTSIDMIASGVGLTKGAIYWHFDGKDALFEAILEMIRARWQEAVLRQVSAGTPAPERLRQLFDGYARLFTATPEICLFLQRVLLENDDTYSPRVARVFRQTASVVAGILEDGKRTGHFRKDVDSQHMARLVLASISGSSQQHLVTPSVTLEALLDEARAMTLARVASARRRQA
jgi:AcrR family transcriptional regulator